MTLRVLAVVQARLGSTRLPGKALEEIAHRPMLSHVLDRALAVPGVDLVVLATTVNSEDTTLVELAASDHKVPSVRGSIEDVLDRFHKAWLEYPADSVLRITADCPLLDPTESGRVVQDYLDHRHEVDYVSNVEPPTYPDGLDTEIFSGAALERAWNDARLPSDREHVTTYLRAGTRVRTRNVRHTENLSTQRWTVDEPRDLEFVRAVYDHLAPDGHRIFGMHEVLDLLRKHPELSAINAGFTRNEGLERSRRLDGAGMDGGTRG